MTTTQSVLVAVCAAAVAVACSDDGDPGPSAPTPVTPVATLWRGLMVEPEDRCTPYSPDDYPYSPSVEDAIVAQLGGVFSPYTCEVFDSTARTDIEHIVARSEAHDSGLCAADALIRRRFAEDLANLTLAAPALNRHAKSGNDAAEWLPDENACWFAQTVVDVRRKYGLTIDEREAEALDRVLSACSTTAISCALSPILEPEPDPPPVRAFPRCSEMRAVGWKRGVNRDGGTYRASWDAAERKTYLLNTARDRDGDGHACES